MNISEISIRRPVFAWMLMAFLIIFGWISFQRMGISQLPDVDFPVITISLSYEGAAPEVMETDIVDVVEDAVMTVQGIRTVSSSSRYAAATVTIEFDLNRNIDVALQEVQTKVAQAQRNLPREMDPPVITKTNPEDQPIIWLALSSTKHSTRDIMKYVRDILKNKFSTVPGVGEVFLGGFVEPNLRVWVANDKLTKYQLTVTDVLNAIQNEHSELPGGQIDTGIKEKDVRTLGEAKSAEEFANLPINTRGGQPVHIPIYLKQVAKVEEGLAEIRRISRTMGEPAVGLGIRKQRGSNAVATAQAVKKRMEELRPTLPEGMSLNVNFDSTQFIEESVGELNFTLLLSAILTSLVCWVFLGSFSSTLNVLMAIPTSIVGAFIVLSFAGFTLNTFTLLGLSLAIGIVVDDAIMVLENIVRHREEGASRMDAALIGSKEITFAAIAATVAIIAIFLPVAFMRGAIGKFFFQFGVTMTVAVALSLLEALTLTPMRCSQFVEAAKRSTRLGHFAEASFEWSQNIYQKVLARILHHRWKVVGSSLLFFFASIMSVKALNKEFVPSQDQGAFIARLQTPEGSSISYTDSRFKEAEQILAKNPAVKRNYVAIGGFGGGEVNTGIMFITLKDPKERPYDEKLKRRVTQQDVMNDLRKTFGALKDMKVFLQDLSMRGFTGSRGYPLEFTVRGPEWEKIAQYSQVLIDKINATGLVQDLDSDYRLGKTEVRIFPDRAKAAARGVSVRSISETVNALVGGVVRGKYSTEGHRYDIRIRLEPDQRESADRIKDLFVANNRGEFFPLSDLVHLEERPTLQQINRYDRERAVSIFGNIKPGQSQAAALEAVQRIAKEVLPDGYRVVLSGSSQSFKESFQDLNFALILRIIVAYMVLASQFNSFVHPITVLLALPFSISGAFLALLVAQQSLNIYSFIGLILLMGIVKKNSILLVDFTNQMREKGMGPREALIHACPLRLRPIMMTSFATIAGAIPPALAIGPGAETRIPMAVCVIGGVLVSTFLTLLVVPCVYSLFSQLERHKKDAAEASNSTKPAHA